jgi:tetratricopeptide (TPR) repeat protein
LQLDDETANSAVDVVTEGPGSVERLVRRVKNLGCVWKEGNGSWHITEDVRPHLVDRLYKELPETTIISVRERLAESAEARANRSIPDSQIGVYSQLLAKFEAAYQRLFIPKSSSSGAKELAELWQQAPSEVGRTLARSVDHLAGEFEARVGYLPDEVLFLRGIAAQDRKDVPSQEECFGEVWKRGCAGSHDYVHAQASNFYALLIQHRDPETAERALRDSIEWTEAAHERGLIYQNLGDLLARKVDAWDQAEHAYIESLKLLHESQHKMRVNSSLNNLLARNPHGQRERAQDYVTETARRSEQQREHAQDYTTGVGTQRPTYTEQYSYASQAEVNGGQQRINGELCRVDWKLVQALRAVNRLLATLRPDVDRELLEEVEQAVEAADRVSMRVADIKPPGCAPELRDEDVSKLTH